MPTLAAPQFNSWFELDDSGVRLDAYVVLDFLRVVPQGLRSIFSEDWFISFLEEDNAKNSDDKNNISPDQFFRAFDEAEKVLYQGLQGIDQQLKDDDFFDGFDNQLTMVGFTRTSLQIKGRRLNKLWDDVKRSSENVGQFVFRPFFKTMLKFLGFLNKVLGSLLKVIPATEAIKEIKDFAESYIDVD